MAVLYIAVVLVTVVFMGGYSLLWWGMRGGGRKADACVVKDKGQKKRKRKWRQKDRSGTALTMY